ncbi:MAG: hypothetical protein JWP11_940 [Frankiales bacterium]|nr:hypothetical protein [Frankiales bacterium]
MCRASPFCSAAHDAPVTGDELDDAEASPSPVQARGAAARFLTIPAGTLLVLAGTPLPWLLTLIPALHATVYTKRALRCRGQGSKTRRVAVQALVRTHVALAVVAYTLLAGQLLGALLTEPGSPWRSVAACSGAVFLFFWAYHLQELNVRRDRAMVPRFSGEDSKQLHMLKLLRLDGAAVTPNGEHAAPAGVRPVLILAVVASLVAVWPANPASTNYRRITTATAAWLDHAGPRSASPQAGAAQPSAMSVSPIELCPDVEAVRQTLTADVPADTGRAMFRAWYGTGRIAAGCPLGPAAHVGQLVVVQLTGGADSPAAIYARGDRAAVVFSDFYALVAQRASSLALVEPRRRWGLGTLQLVRAADGSCDLLQRYGDAAPVALPASVSSLVLSIADRTGAMPRLTGIWPASAQTQYTFDLIAPDPVLGQRTVDDVLIAYAEGTSVFTRTGASASDRDPCPPASQRLAIVAAAVENAVQRASKMESESAAPAP